MPEFSYSNGILNVSENVNAYDSEFDFSFISDTSKDGSNENINELSKEIKNQGLVLLKDKAVLVNNGNSMIIDYLQLQNDYGIDELNKSIITEKIDSIGIIGITIMYFVIILFGFFIIESISIFTDWLILSIFAYCAVKITRTDLNYKQTFNISIYALTLSIILYMIYCVANFAFDFYTQYFKTIYLLIAYVYIVAVILIIKSDLIKQKAMIGKVEEIKENEKEQEDELEEEQEDKESEKKDDKEKKDNNDDEDVIDGEPDGSEI